MKRVSVEQFHALLKQQQPPSREDAALVCPACLTVQSANDLIEAGAGKTFAEVEKFLGFSCVGRWKHSGPVVKFGVSNGGKGCDWTLGGLFRMHTMEVVTADGKYHMTFEPATKKQARQHLAKKEKNKNATRIK